MGLATCKVPAAIATGVICFALGAGAGIGGMAWYGYPLKKLGGEESAPSTPGGGPGGMMGSAGGPPGGMMGMMAGRGPNPKSQLATLVVKLDQVTGGTLTVNLTAGQKKKVQEQLQGLADQEVVDEEDAKKKLEALLDALKDHKETLEAAGYRWPGQRGGMGGGMGMGMGGGMRPPPEPPPNPFKQDNNAKHLKSLQGQLAKPASAEKPAS